MKFRLLKPLTILSTLLIIFLCFTASASAFFVSSEKTRVGNFFSFDAFFTRNFLPLTADNTPDKNYDDKKFASDSLLGPKSKYLDITKGKSILNIATDVNPIQFEKNLIEAGFSKTLSSDKAVTIFTKGNFKYTIRSSAKSIKAPTVEVFKDGVKIKKIRLLSE